jgi:hypothetical protein
MGHSSAVTSAEVDASQQTAIRALRSWRRFHYRKRRGEQPLLATVDRYPNAVFVAGCQRSGTTMLTRLVANSAGFRPLCLTHDDELDAALILCGEVDLPSDVRYCFQTTYLNERFHEYRSLRRQHRLVWVVRNPYSVVYSMVYNWSRFALNELYAGCCDGANQPTAMALEVGWPFGPPQIEKAARAYAAKTSQIFKILQLVDRRQVMLVHYDDLVREPRPLLERLFGFVGGKFQDEHVAAVRSDSAGKASGLSADARQMIETIAEPTYRECLTLI